MNKSRSNSSIQEYKMNILQVTAVKLIAIDQQ